MLEPQWRLPALLIFYCFLLLSAESLHILNGSCSAPKLPLVFGSMGLSGNRVLDGHSSILMGYHHPDWNCYVCTIIYMIILIIYYIILYYNILYYIILYYWNYIILYYIINIILLKLYYIILYYITLYYIILDYIILYYIILYTLEI